MAKARKNHIQLELPKLDKNGQRRGGKRKGAGRKPKNGAKARAAHDPRPTLKPREPIHVTLRVVESVTNLRRRHIYPAVRSAVAALAHRRDFRIVHMSIQDDHLHLLVEVDNEKALGRAMRSFASVAARHINEAITKHYGCARSGKVFDDRYNERIIRTPRQARNALRYVLNNWRKHGEDRTPLTSAWLLDPFSSASRFDGWAEFAPGTKLVLPPAYEELPTRPARTWLLQAGWKRGGGLISVRDVPGG